jgi:hypothetical protein
MTYEQFELAVIQLARQGVRLTLANVCAGLHLEFARAEAWLDQMAQDGRLDVELDESEGLVFYRVRGLGPMPSSLQLRAPQPVQRAPRRGKKSALVAVAFGLLVPGAGLLYAAPWSVALAGGLLAMVLVKMVGALPLLGGLLSSVVLGLCALSSALLGVLYTKQYNRYGRRTHLEADALHHARGAAARSGFAG